MTQQTKDKLEEAVLDKHVWIEIPHALNPNREDGRFLLKKWTFRKQMRFGSGFLKAIQDLFQSCAKVTGTLDSLSKIEKIEDLVGLNVNWGKLLEDNFQYIQDVIEDVIRPAFKTKQKAIDWIDDNISFLGPQANAFMLIAKIFNFNFRNSKKVEGDDEKPPTEIARD